jgi:hypothetical protein
MKLSDLHLAFPYVEVNMLSWSRGHVSDSLPVVAGICLNLKILNVSQHFPFNERINKDVKLYTFAIYIVQ